jgi:hypothetical protein
MFRDGYDFIQEHIKHQIVIPLFERCVWYIVCILRLSFVIVGSVVYPQDLMLVRQVLYHLSQPLTLNVFVY